MPLHNVIPLCNFKYVRDIHSCATFSYDTTGQISKDEGIKPAVIDRVIEIEKIKTKLIHTSACEIDKLMVKRSLVAQTVEINIEHSREYRRESPIMDKVMISMELEQFERELNKSESQNLEFKCIREIYFTTSKDFEGETRLIDKTMILKDLKVNELSGVTKVSNLNVELDKTGKGNIDKICEKIVDADSPIKLNKIDDPLSMVNDTIVELSNYDYDSPLELIYSGELNKDDAKHYIDRINESEIIKDHTTIFIDRVDLKEITKDDSQRYSIPYAIIDIDYNESKRLVYRDVITPIDQYNHVINLDRITEKYIDKDKGKHLFYRSMVRPMDYIQSNPFLEPLKVIPINNNNTRYFHRLHLTPIYKEYKHQLDRIHTTDMFKIEDKYADRIYYKDIFKPDSIGLNNISIILVYKEFEKTMLNLTIEDIYKEESRSLNGTMIKEIELPRANKFIEVTKRWWWLHETSPNDRLILPNKDYGKMRDLLSNENYEYLRYSKHPIDWGKTWGKDANIPPAAISIEIMVDLTNIITMIWHKSAQSWLSVSGKEGIQLLMELLYDWYSMATSKPNRSYYRVYRWVRWEAEKVYFLNTTSGLQAIGILVKNLRDYLKLHHFNIVPIWRNPKAMDEERNFNRLAQNGDLIVDLNKNKGKRHYHIETQNFEKENKLIQAKT